MLGLGKISSKGTLQWVRNLSHLVGLDAPFAGANGAFIYMIPPCSPVLNLSNGYIPNLSAFIQADCTHIAVLTPSKPAHITITAGWAKVRSHSE